VHYCLKPQACNIFSFYYHTGSCKCWSFSTSWFYLLFYWCFQTKVPGISKESTKIDLNAICVLQARWNNAHCFQGRLWRIQFLQCKEVSMIYMAGWIFPSSKLSHSCFYTQACDLLNILSKEEKIGYLLLERVGFTWWDGFFPSSKLSLMFISWRDLIRPCLWHIAYCPIHGNLDLLSHLLRYFIRTMTLIFVDHSSAWAFNHVSTWFFYCIAWKYFGSREAVATHGHTLVSLYLRRFIIII
jgi:hypothetical protein